MASVKERLRLLSDYVAGQRPPLTTFIVAGGGEFHTPLTPEEYLLQYGAHTPDGRRIVLYPHPVEGVDPLSLSLYQMIDEGVELGGLDLPEPESDDL